MCPSQVRPPKAALLALMLAVPLVAEARMQCWTNSEGITECGNVVPPEYAQQEVRTLDRRGITTEVRPRARTPEEIEADRQREAEEERRQAEEDKRRREQESRDRVLLATYLSEEDIIRTRDRMTGTINASIELNRINIERLNERLAEARSRAASYERQGRPIPEQVQEDITTLENQIVEREAYIASREEERDAMHQRYQQDLLRFRELMQQR